MYKTKYIEVIEEFLRWQRERRCEIIQPGRGLHSELRPEGEQEPGEGRVGRVFQLAGGHVGEQWGLARSIWAALAGGRHSYSRGLGI